MLSVQEKNSERLGGDLTKVPQQGQPGSPSPAAAGLLLGWDWSVTSCLTWDLKASRVLTCI